RSEDVPQSSAIRRARSAAPAGSASESCSGTMIGSMPERRPRPGALLSSPDPMTLTELKYIVALARERHFGRAAEACFVSQPTLSVAIKKLEEELGVQLFERGGTEVAVTPIGEQIVEQAQHVLEQSNAIREIAAQGRDPLAGALRVGVIYTIGPYLLPYLVRQMIADAPQMPLLLQENFTTKLLELLRQGDIDVAILADPFHDGGLVTQAVYDEPFIVAVPNGHPWQQRERIRSAELKEQTML